MEMITAHAVKTLETWDKEERFCLKWEVSRKIEHKDSIRIHVYEHRALTIT